MNSYRTEISYQSEHTPSDRERGTSIEFLAPSDREAALGVYRWWRNRAASDPQYFTRILCIKIYRLALSEFQEDGYLRGSTGMCLFEWKVDTAGLPYAEYVDHRLGDGT